MGVVMAILTFIYILFGFECSFLMAGGLPLPTEGVQTVALGGPSNNVNMIIGLSLSPYVFAASSGKVLMLDCHVYGCDVLDDAGPGYLEVVDIDKIEYSSGNGTIIAVFSDGTVKALYYNSTGFNGTEVTITYNSTDVAYDPDNQILWIANGTHILSFNASFDLKGNWTDVDNCSDPNLEMVSYYGDSSAVYVAAYDANCKYVYVLNGTDPQNPVLLYSKDVSSYPEVKELLMRNVNGSLLLFLVFPSVVEYYSVEGGLSWLGNLIAADFYPYSSACFSNNRVLVGGDNGVMVWNLENASDPYIETFYYLPEDRVNDVYCTDGYVLVATQREGIMALGYSFIYDYEVGLFYGNGSLYTFDLAGGKLRKYIYDGILNLDNETEIPEYVDSYKSFREMLDGTKRVSISSGSGGNIYLSIDNNIYEFSSDLSLVKKSSFYSNIIDLEDTGTYGYLYAILGGYKVAVVNATGASIEVLNSTWCSFAPSEKVIDIESYSYDDKSYLAVLTDKNLYILPGCNVTDPQDLWLPLSSLYLGDLAPSSMSVVNRPDGVYIFLTGKRDILYSVNATNAYGIEPLGGIPRVLFGSDLKVTRIAVGETGFAVVGTNKGLYAFNVIDPSSPVLFGKSEYEGLINDVTVANYGGIVFVSSGGIRVFSVILSSPSGSAPSLLCYPYGVVFLPDKRHLYNCTTDSVYIRWDIGNDGDYEIEDWVTSTNVTAYIYLYPGVHPIRVEAFGPYGRRTEQMIYAIVSDDCANIECPAGKICGCFLPFARGKGYTKTFNEGDGFKILYCAYMNGTAVDFYDLYFFLETNSGVYVLSHDQWINWEDMSTSFVASYATLKNELNSFKPYCTVVASGMVPEGLSGNFTFIGAFVSHNGTLNASNLMSNIAVLNVEVQP